MKTQVMRRIAEDGSEEIRRPNDGKKFTLKELQSAVGGLIERVQMRPGNGHGTMWANEEGLLHGMSINFKATGIARPEYQGIVGPVAIVFNEEKHG